MIVLPEKYQKEGARLRSLREAAGVTQTELAQLLGSSQTAVGQWEMGKKLPKTGVLMSICQRFGVTPNHILLGVADEDEEPDYIDIEAEDDLGMSVVEFGFLAGQLHGTIVSLRAELKRQPDIMDDLPTQWKKAVLALLENAP